LVGGALSQIALCYELKNKSFFSNRILFALTLSPIPIGVIATYFPNAVTTSVSENVGNTAKISFVFATVYLASIRHYRYVIATALGYGVEVILDRDQISYEHREPIQKVLGYTALFYTIVFEESYFQRGLGLLTLASYGERIYAPYLFGSYEANIVSSGEGKTFDEMADLQTGINPEHLGRQPKQVEVAKPYEGFIQDLNLLRGAAENTDYSEGVNLFLDRMQKKKGALSGESFSSSLASQGIEIADPENFETLQVIVQKLTRVDMNGDLFQVIQDQCAHSSTPQMRQALFKLDKKYFEKDSTAEAILFNLLREKQEEYLSDVIKKETSWKPDIYNRLFGGVETVQFWNSYLYYYGEPIGMHLDGADEDVTIDEESTRGLRLLYFYWVRNVRQRFFEEHYTEENVIRWVQDANERLTEQKLRNWFETQEIFGKNLFEEGRLSHDAARYFLLKNGVLGLT
ncbi:MAG: hypothetical protein KDK76_07475, partial [Chlamydiia bacterium]|nr:hypothetical protein [Chlamydiia bacterium]